MVIHFTHVKIASTLFPTGFAGVLDANARQPAIYKAFSRVYRNEVDNHLSVLQKPLSMMKHTPSIPKSSLYAIIYGKCVLSVIEPGYVT